MACLDTTSVLLMQAQATIANEKTDQTLQQDDIGNTVKPISTTTPTLPTIPTVGCAMDAIESLQSFLSCLGAK